MPDDIIMSMFDHKVHSLTVLLRTTVILRPNYVGLYWQNLLLD